MQRNAVKIGCCGFPVGKERYFDNFKVVELQVTFYQPPLIQTIQRWKDGAPVDFEFTLKAWQLITHTALSPTYRRLKIKIPEDKKKYYGNFQPTDEVFSAWQTTDEIAEVLNSRIILFQCPASFKPTSKNLKNMQKFFHQIKRKAYQFCFEPRGNWPVHLIQRVCRDLNLIHCVDPFKAKPLFGKINYFRLHGVNGYNYRYCDEELKSLLDLVKIKKLETYIMFNNLYIFRDAQRLKRYFKGKLPNLP